MLKSDMSIRARRTQGTPSVPPPSLPLPAVCLVCQSGLASSHLRRALFGLATRQGWILVGANPDDGAAGMELVVGTDVRVVALVVGSNVMSWLPARFHDTPVIVAVADADPPPEVACVQFDEEAVGAAAAGHVLALQCASYSAFGIGNPRFFARRHAGFRRAVEQAGACYVPGGDVFRTNADSAVAPAIPNVVRWLTTLPRPAAILAGCDGWATILLTACRVAGLSVPDDIAIIGVDNDEPTCEMAIPPLSSVALPWGELARQTADLICRLSRARRKPAKPPHLHLPPLEVVARQSTDLLRTPDPVVRQALRVIRAGAGEPISTEDVLRQVPTHRRALERAFRAALNQTVMHTIRKAHVERAKQLLRSADLSMPELARHSGFSDASKLSHAFRRETGMTPTAYRALQRHGRSG